jgi:hypothetical protein
MVPSVASEPSSSASTALDSVQQRAFSFRLAVLARRMDAPHAQHGQRQQPRGRQCDQEMAERQRQPAGRAHVIPR